MIGAEARRALALHRSPGWPAKAGARERPRAALVPLAAHYFLHAARLGPRVDPVARFHLGNGARLERINPLGDLSETGLRQSLGLMVN